MNVSLEAPPIERTPPSAVEAPEIAAARAYRRLVEDALAGDDWGDGIEEAARRAAATLRRARQRELSPSWSRAALTTLKSALLVIAPLVLAERLFVAGAWWAALPLVLLGGLAMYGVISIIHDLAHDAFVPNRRANRLLGRFAAPLILLDFDSFRRSHRTHHLYSQSPADPKRYGVTRSQAANQPSDCTLDRIPRILRPPVLIAARVTRLPVAVRHVVYLVGMFVVIGPMVLLGAGEFSLIGRPWKKLGTWSSAAVSVAAGVLLWWWSPVLLVMAGAALWLGYSAVLLVFLTHLSPNQIFWYVPRRATSADALNVSDVHCGRLLRFFGHGFSEHHAVHHLSPWIPCYNLPAADATVAEELRALRAPPIDLTRPAGCALLFDGMVLGLARPKRESWTFLEGVRMRAIHVAPPGEAE